MARPLAKQCGQLVVGLALVASAGGCRADIEGNWQGRVGAERACLSLGQDGANISGMVRIDGDCRDDVYGEVEEEQLTLFFGCSGCTVIMRTRLDLTIHGDSIHGTADLLDCDCPAAPEACHCVLDATLERAPTCDTRW